MPSVQDLIRNSKFISESKNILIEDCIFQLEGEYGLKKNGIFEDLSFLPNLIANSVQLNIRKDLESFIYNQVASGRIHEQAVDSLIKEYAFTYLNRFVALKMMEERRIIKQSFSHGYESNNFKFFLADNPDDEILWRQGKPHEAYKNFLSFLFVQLSSDDEIKILFDPYAIQSKIFPQEKTLRYLFDIINHETLNDIWKEDEVIGWVYQYFIEDEKEKVFAKIYQEKKKLDLRDLPAATQIFTPKWIVKYLIENTLGRLWLRMHPDSKLREKMSYFVPNEQDKTEKQLLKNISAVTLLDPACGTMHFGIYAFDLFYEMYLEEFVNAGNEGWLVNASVNDESEIAKSIIENNLYGIDIDLRAFQLSALSLYLKAKSKNKNVSLKKYNLTYTDIPPFSEESINKFVNELSVEHDLTKKLLQKILPLFNKAYYLGSLLKIEETVESFVELEKVSLKKAFNTPDLFGFNKQPEQLGLELYNEKKIIWDDVKKEIITALLKFTKTHKDAAVSSIAGQSVKGLSLIDALIKKHDVVVANPPYNGRKNWPKFLSNDLSKIYGANSSDLYSCFIDRAISLTMPKGFIGLITVHSFMFTSSYKYLREQIIKQSTIETMCHLGTHTEFELSNPNAQGFTMYILQNYISKNISEEGIYFRIIKENNIDKDFALQKSISSYKNSDLNNNKYYILKQSKLEIIPNYPILYWIDDKIRNLFIEEKLLIEYSKPYTGLSTGNNFRFLRFWWEVNQSNIKVDCKSVDESITASEKWYPCMKGGALNNWYGNQDYLVNWQFNGFEIKHTFNDNGRLAARPQNQKYYFKNGLTYTYLTISKMSVRIVPEGFICDHAGNGIYVHEPSHMLVLLGLLNSNMVAYLFKLLNPTVHKEVGDLQNVPIIIPTEKELEYFNDNVSKCIDIKKQYEQTNESSRDFDAPPSWYDGLFNQINFDKVISLNETLMSKKVYEYFNCEKQIIHEIENEITMLPGDMEKVEDINNPSLNSIKNLYLEKHVPSEVLKQNDGVIEYEEDENEEEEQEESSRGRGKQSRFLTFDEICLASGFHPDTVYNYIVTNKLERSEERYELAVKWISYTVGILMGRLTCEGMIPDDDGICILDEGHDDDLPKNIYSVLEKCLGENEAKEVTQVISQSSGSLPVEVLRKFLERDFFTKWHIPMYKKRPVYWLLQTKKKSYGFYIYNLKFSSESLYSLVQKYIDPKLKLETTKLHELQAKRDSSSGPEKRQFENEIAAIEDLMYEIEEFKNEIQSVIASGFKPDIDDGVILNMAPIYKLVPSWKEPEKFYKELEKGKYDWSTVSKTLFNKAVLK